MEKTRNQIFKLFGVGSVLIFLGFGVLILAPKLFKSDPNFEQSSEEIDAKTRGANDDIEPKELAVDENQEVEEDAYLEVAEEKETENPQSDNEQSDYNPSPQPNPNPSPAPVPSPIPQPENPPVPEPEEQPDPITYNTYVSSIFDWSFKYNSLYGGTIVDVWDTEGVITGESVRFTDNQNLTASLLYIDINGFGSGGNSEDITVHFDYLHQSNENKDFRIYGYEIPFEGLNQWAASANYFNEDIPNTENDYFLTYNLFGDTDSFEQEAVKDELETMVETTYLDESTPVSFPVL